MAVPMTNIGGRGRRYHRFGLNFELNKLDSFAERTDLCRQYSLSPVKKYSPVSLTLENIFPLKIKFSSCIY